MSSISAFVLILSRARVLYAVLGDTGTNGLQRLIVIKSFLIGQLHGFAITVRSTFDLIAW